MVVVVKRVVRRSMLVGSHGGMAEACGGVPAISGHSVLRLEWLCLYCYLADLSRVD
jgi:hypothetical protein